MVRHIPGFKGYLEKEYRRDSDQLARSWIADQLQKSKVALDRWQRSLVDQGQIDHLPLCDRLRSRIDGLQAKIKSAMRGYSGFFDFVRVDEALLEQVYHLDLGLVDEAAALAQSIESGGDQPPQARLNELERKVDELARAFDKRHELLEGLN
jgi:hypothetical protein